MSDLDAPPCWTFAQRILASDWLAARDAAAAKAATAGALRYAAGLIFGLDEELAETLYRVADEAAAYDFAEDLPCCPVCEEVICDDGCPFEPYRAAQVAPSRVPGEES